MVSFMEMSECRPKSVMEHGANWGQAVWMDRPAPGCNVT